MYVSRKNRKIASDHNVQSSDNLDDFENRIPTQTYDTARRDLNTQYGLDSSSSFVSNSSPISIHPYRKPTSRNILDQFQDLYASNYAINEKQSDHIVKAHRSSIVRTLLWPTFAICIPIGLLSAALIIVVLKFEIKPRINSFGTPDGDGSYASHSAYILVNISATQIVFLASFLSTMAPLLAGCIMSLVSVLVCRNLQKTSTPSQFSNLPTPYQMSLLVGILAASYQQLFSSLAYLFSRRRQAKAPPILYYTAFILLISVLLGGLVTVTDALLHFYTTTISFDLYNPVLTTSQAGKGLNQLCANFDRTTNQGLPCSVPDGYNFSDPNYYSEQREMSYLHHNTSAVSEIRHADLSGSAHQDIAYLIPRASSMDVDTDYRATTIGVSTQCHFIPPSNCNLTTWGTYNIYTSFNYSAFYGTLGKDPLTSETDSSREPDPYVSFLALKPHSNVQYGYFSGPDLETVYNPMGYNDSGSNEDPKFQPYTDAELRNPIYMALAGRQPLGAFSDDSAMLTSSQSSHMENVPYLEYLLNCEVMSHDVEYIWFNNSLQSITATPTKNGSVLEIWHGQIPFVSVAGDYDIQDVMEQSATAGTTVDSFTERFAQLISEKALAAIGGYTSPRMVLQQQSRTQLLVAKVPKPALGALLACSLAYPVLGLILLLKVCRSLRGDFQMTPLFSYWGLASTAWNEKGGTEGQCWASQEENLRLYVQDHPEKGFRFGLWTRGSTGYVVESQ